MIYFFDIIASIVSGILSSMGVGGGGILLIYLTLYRGINQMQAQGINLIFFVFVSLFSTIFFTSKNLVNLKKISLLMIFGILGSIIGFKLSLTLNSTILCKIFGVSLLIIGVFQLFKRST